MLRSFSLARKANAGNAWAPAVTLSAAKNSLPVYHAGGRTRGMLRRTLLHMTSRARRAPLPTGLRASPVGHGVGGLAIASRRQCG